MPDRNYQQKPPQSKRELLNRMLSYDFDGDLRKLGPSAQISRVNANTLELRFPATDQTYLLSVHIPRGEKAGRSTAASAPADDFSDEPETPKPTTRGKGRRQ
jgi:hypothetical protein